MGVDLQGLCKYYLEQTLSIWRMLTWGKSPLKILCRYYLLSFFSSFSPTLTLTFCLFLNKFLYFRYCGLQNSHKTDISRIQYSNNIPPPIYHFFHSCHRFSNLSEACPFVHISKLLNIACFNWLYWNYWRKYALEIQLAGTTIYNSCMLRGLWYIKYQYSIKTNKVSLILGQE